MLNHLKFFETHSEYETYINGENKYLPNVSYCEEEIEVHYNPIVPETRLIATFNVENTSQPINIISSDSYADINMYTEIEVDGIVLENISKTHTFSTTGEHTVKYTLADPTTIGTYAFGSCASLTSVTIPSSVTSIGDSVFVECTGLTSITIPDNVTSIGDSVLQECTGLTSVTIGNGVTTFGEQAFAICTSLTNVIIGSSVTSISDGAFVECTGLTSITIPDNVTSIGQSAFIGCNSLVSVTVEATTPPTLGNSAFNDNASGRKIYVPSASVSTYQSASGWSAYASDIEAMQSA